MERNITAENLLAFERRFDETPYSRVLQSAVARNGIHNATQDVENLRALPEHYSIDLEAGTVCNQKQSGRCWMFAAYNVFRLQVMKKLNLANMELSQAYPLFYDKLEKSNFFLENILSTLSEEVSSRLLSHLLRDPIGDGGQWNMFVGLTKKYGVCPKELMPETACSSNTREMDRYITLRLRKGASELRRLSAEGKSLDVLWQAKEGILADVYRILVLCLGKPPVSFTYETQDKDRKFVRIENVTPKQFYERYVGIDLDDYVSVINAPTKDKPFYRSFTVRYLGNIVGEEVRYVNLPIQELKDLVVRQLQDGEVVWFGSDVGQFSNRNNGFLSRKNFDLEDLFSTSLSMSKEDRLDYGESLMTHAMVFTGVNIDAAGRPNRFKVENSWGPDTGYKGFYAMDEDWFEQFVYQAVIHRKHLDAKQWEAYQEEPIALQPWDPMGSLAL